MTVAQCRAQSWQPVTVGALRYEWADARMAEAEQRVLRLLRGGRGMCDNPANVRVFGIRDAERRCRALAAVLRPGLARFVSQGRGLGGIPRGPSSGCAAWRGRGAVNPLSERSYEWCLRW